MTLHEVELNVNEWEMFRRSGALSVKHYPEKITKTDSVMIRNLDGACIGPFFVRDDSLGVYCGTDRNAVQILCRLPEMEDTDYEECDDTVTGSFELDGLLRNCRMDEKKGRYYVSFEKDVSDAVPIYSKMLVDAGVSNTIVRGKNLYIADTEICKRCLEQPLRYDERFLAGLFAPNMYSKKGSPGRDATPDLEIARGLKNIPSDLDLDLLPWRVILYRMNAVHLISALSFNNHPCNESIWGFCNIDEYQPEQSCCISDEGLAGFVASELMIEMLYMSGYSVDVMWSTGNVRYITARCGEKLYDVVLTPYIDDRLRSCFDVNAVPMESLLILTRTDDAGLHIVRLMDVEKSDYDDNAFDIFVQNLDINAFIPLVPPLVREMKSKLDVIWSI